MSEFRGTHVGVGWTANPQQAGPQYQALEESRPIYQAAGARRAPALDAQNAPSDVYVAAYSDGQHAIGVVCAGVAESFFGGLAAQEVGAALREWVWAQRAAPPTEREISNFLTGLQGPVADRVGSQGASILLNQGGAADLLRRRDQVGAQTSVGVYLLSLDRSAMFYLLGNLRAHCYPPELTAAPTVYAGDPQALWSSRIGIVGRPQCQTQRPVLGVSIVVADLPAAWGSQVRNLYQAALFGQAAAATAATVSVGYAIAMIDPQVGPPTVAPPVQTSPAAMGRTVGTAATNVIPLNDPPPQPRSQAEWGGGPVSQPPAQGALGADPAEPLRYPTGGAQRPAEAASLDAGFASQPRQEQARGADIATDPDLDDLDFGFAEEDAGRGPIAAHELRRSGGAVGARRPDEFADDPGADGPFAGARSLEVGGVPLGTLLPPGNTRTLVGVGLGVVGVVFVLLCLVFAIPALLAPKPGGVATGTPRPTAPGTPTVDPVAAGPGKFAVTGRFHEVWQSDGGLEVFGFAINAAHTQGGLMVQDFQRFRFEYHPEAQAPYDVQFANLGTKRYHEQGGVDAPAAKKDDPACRWFADTQHNVCGSFKDFWEKHGRNLGPGGNPEQGAFALFGEPISDEYPMTLGGIPMTVQWFQKARFEAHTSEPLATQFHLGLIGWELQGR